MQIFFIAWTKIHNIKRPNEHNQFSLFIWNLAHKLDEIGRSIELFFEKS
uniref:Uncharacterized protein n=1 Tax=Romanomermis culicivorax TaxID=13658 RepID=A0A915J838_ROMCU